MKKKMIACVLAFAMAAGLAACGNASGANTQRKLSADTGSKNLGDDAEHPLPDIPATETVIAQEAETEAPEDDPSMGSDYYDRTGMCNVLRWEVPESWMDNFSSIETQEADGSWCTEFYEEPDYSNDGIGWLFSLVQIKGNDPDQYRYLPHYNYLGEVRLNNGETYGIVAAYPTDVQPSEENMDLYSTMYDDIDSLLASITADGNAEFVRGEGGESEYIIAYSDYVYLSDYDIADLTKGELRLARNEIFARHGRRFKDKELQAHFDSCSWYNGTIEPADFDDSVLSECEVANIRFLKKAEAAR